MLDLSLRAELEGYMRSDEYLLGQIFNLYTQGVTNAKDLVSQSSAANSGVVYNNLAMIKALLESKIPKGATISRHSAWAVGRILKNNLEISNELKNYLNDLKVSLLNNSENLSAVIHDQVIIDNQSDELAKKASVIKNGIYVYSFPTYLHYRSIEDPDLTWFKIGFTGDEVWKRIIGQNRQTSMPEDPKLLRIYHREGMILEEIEKTFHTTLEAFGQERAATRHRKAGTEWFATTLNAIDALAKAMSLEIESYEPTDENL